MTLSEVVAVSLVHSFVTNLFCVGVDPNSSDSQSASQALMVAQGCSGLLCGLVLETLQLCYDTSWAMLGIVLY